jgi:hypothetical protein
VASRSLLRAVGAAVAIAFLLAGCGTRFDPDANARYMRWYRSHATSVIAYQQFLEAQGVGGVVPMPQLLRTVRDWRKCGSEFAVPPARAWPAIVPTLRLLAELRRDGHLAGKVRVASAWRSAEMNACAGGAPRSKHLGNGAIDLDWDAPADGLERLCAAWGGDTGGKHAWGLGFYTRKRIHLDTYGYRTWGHDYRSRTSLCVAGPD